MYYDTCKEKSYITKSTVVEFKNYLVLIEMPISSDGGGTSKLKDYTEGGEMVLTTLKKQFPTKPLKYVLSTHWHPHSISSILPFISRGIVVVTTTKNFKRISEYVDSISISKYGKYLQFIDKDGFMIKDKSNSIVAYYLDKKEYPHIPTEDFLFYYLPKYNYLHNSCMFQRLKGSSVYGKEMISSRVEDLHKLIKAKHISPDYFITSDIWFDDSSGMASGDTLALVYKNGITMTTLEQQILDIDENSMKMESDSILKTLMDNRMPYSILLNAVYTCLRENKLQKALAVAKILAAINPSDPNVWDTLGEVYFFLGETKLAKKYEAQCKRIDKDWTKGGETNWKQNYKDYSASWLIE